VRQFSSDAADLSPEFGILAGRWEQYGDLGHVPFQAMWCLVTPGTSTDEDRHPERELVTVTRGAGTVRTASGEVAVAAGESFLLDSDEAHVIRNPSSTDPLVLLSIYWHGSAQDAR